MTTSVGFREVVREREMGSRLEKKEEAAGDREGMYVDGKVGLVGEGLEEEGGVTTKRSAMGVRVEVESGRVGEEGREGRGGG